MVEQHLPLRATGLARALGVLVLLAGIVAMHAAVFAVHGHADAASSDHAMARTSGDAMAEEIGGTLRTLTLSTDTTPLAMSVEHEIAGTDGRDLMAMPTVVTLSDTNHGAPGADCAGDGCSGTHGGMHGCVFILAAAALLLALVLLYRIAIDRPGNGVARLRHRRPRRERSPPWTVLSLAELSILRI
ncbi:DUF6153 family protein [Nocardia sp. CA-128927]|uniref:DUF6153 family protein n=1 Tax=Nocardia sp. CA-128927 TaxID=3239975 RepID=UPI003D9990A0